MKRLVFGGVLLVCLFSLTLTAQENFGCPPGMPAAFRPSGDWVPTTNCLGWVPPSHPLAKQPIPPPAPVINASGEDIISRIESPSSGTSVRSITRLSGWALDCTLGAYPPSIRLVETKPDGSLREIPTTVGYLAPFARPDVQEAFRHVCPAVFNMPGSHGESLGPNDLFGWSVNFLSPVTEPGVHTFTVLFAWPAQNHAGSASVSVTVQ